ncbi:ATP-binding protein [Cupriavidus gilardii]|uniref:ATP-binding protein n=1 Tax=Cupriavidus gilardii TaxID=82541 RepID=UPI0021D92298
MSFSLPERIDPRHCIVTKQYAIYTPPMHAMIEQMGEWIDQQRPGGYIYGASRLGKSRCVQWYVGKVLEERFSAVVPLVVWSRRPDSHSNEAAFWHQILMASHFEFVNPAKVPKRVEAAYLCRQRFIAIANNACRNYVVLLIDEAQVVRPRFCRQLQRSSWVSFLESHGRQAAIVPVAALSVVEHLDVVEHV